TPPPAGHRPHPAPSSTPACPPWPVPRAATRTLPPPPPPPAAFPGAKTPPSPRTPRATAALRRPRNPPRRSSRPRLYPCLPTQNELTRPTRRCLAWGDGAVCDGQNSAT